MFQFLNFLKTKKKNLLDVYGLFLFLALKMLRVLNMRACHIGDDGVAHITGEIFEMRDFLFFCQNDTLYFQIELFFFYDYYQTNNNSFNKYFFSTTPNTQLTNKHLSICINS
jgi:hypothetical protein